MQTYRIESTVSKQGAEAKFVDGTPKRVVEKSLTRLFRTYHPGDEPLTLIKKDS